MPSPAYPTAEHPVTFTTTLDDIRSANWALWFRSMISGRKASFAVSCFLFPALAVLILMQDQRDMALTVIGWGSALFPAIYLVSAISILLFNRFSAPGEYRLQKDLHHPIACWWDDDAVFVVIGGSAVRVEWQELLFAAENDAVFVFRQGTLLMRIIPKRAMSPQQIADLGRLLDRQGLRKVRTRLPAPGLQPAPTFAAEISAPDGALWFAYSEEDIAAGMRLHYRRWLFSLRGALALFTAGAGLAVFLALIELAGWSFLPRFPTPVIALSAILFVCLLVLIAFVRFWPLGRMRARKAIRMQPSIALEQGVWWDDDGISYANARGVQLLRWAETVRVAENDSLFLIYQAPRIYHMIPKRVLSTAQCEELDALIRRMGFAKAGRAGK
ncbi:YcxB family protein [Martelella limonii]|uniref:YcxB family protein n=1 Tax=Martelella limonii TaxID=1647649 RepID=UPI001580E237|nr:YcxB family protein [Martelella limonii]